MRTEDMSLLEPLNEEPEKPPVDVDDGTKTGRTSEKNPDSEQG